MRPRATPKLDSLHELASRLHQVTRGRMLVMSTHTSSIEHRVMHAGLPYCTQVQLAQDMDGDISEVTCTLHVTLGDTTLLDLGVVGANADETLESAFQSVQSRRADLPDVDSTLAAIASIHRANSSASHNESASQRQAAADSRLVLKYWTQPPSASALIPLWIRVSQPQQQAAAAGTAHAFRCEVGATPLLAEGIMVHAESPAHALRDALDIVAGLLHVLYVRGWAVSLSSDPMDKASLVTPQAPALDRLQQIVAHAGVNTGGLSRLLTQRDAPLPEELLDMANVLLAATKRLDAGTGNRSEGLAE